MGRIGMPRTVVGDVIASAMYPIVGGIGAGIGLIGRAAREDIRLREQAAATAVMGRQAGKAFAPGATPGELADQYRNLAIVSGVASDEIAEGIHQFVARTGNLPQALKWMNDVATVSVATGSRFKDLANVAVDLMEKFDITSIDEFRTAMATLTEQGKIGAIELQDMARYFAEVAPRFARAGGTTRGTGGIAQLGMLFQWARKGTGTAAEAKTTLSNLLMYLGTKQTQLRRWGVEQYTKGPGGKEQIKDIRDVLIDVVMKVGGRSISGKAKEMAPIFGTRGMRVLDPLVKLWSDAMDEAAKKGLKGADEELLVRTRLYEGLNKFAQAAGDWPNLLQDAATMADQPSRQLTAAWEELKAAASEQLVPALIDLIPHLVGLIPAAEALMFVLEQLAWGATKLLEAFAPERAAKAKARLARREAEEKQTAAKTLEETYEEQLVMPIEQLRKQRRVITRPEVQAAKAEARNAEAKALQAERGASEAERKKGELRWTDLLVPPVGVAKSLVRGAESLGKIVPFEEEPEATRRERENVAMFAAQLSQIAVPSKTVGLPAVAADLMRKRQEEQTPVLLPALMGLAGMIDDTARSIARAKAVIDTAGGPSVAPKVD